MNTKIQGSAPLHRVRISYPFADALDDADLSGVEFLNEVSKGLRLPGLGAVQAEADSRS